jgi:probable F420-dependent oxidoreductase
MALQAEQAKFDSLWLYDHLLYRPEDMPTTGIWECWTILSALAEATKTIELGTLVLCNSFRNPAILAKMAHTIDEVSNGRFILGIGAGWNEPEFNAFGIPFDHRVERFEEALQIIKPLLREGEVNFKGDYYQALNCEILPRSPRPNGPPLMVGSFGPRMMRLTAQYADMWNTCYLHEPKSLDEPLSKFKAACKEVGRNPSSIEITGLVALAYPNLSEPADFMEKYLTGSSEEVASSMHEYEERGVSHLMFHIAPYNTEGFVRIADAVDYYRENY